MTVLLRRAVRSQPKPWDASKRIKASAWLPAMKKVLAGQLDLELSVDIAEFRSARALMAQQGGGWRHIVIDSEHLIGEGGEVIPDVGVKFDPYGCTDLRGPTNPAHALILVGESHRLQDAYTELMRVLASRSEYEDPQFLPDGSVRT